MPNPDESKRRKRIVRQAADWTVRLEDHELGHELDAAGQGEFRRWVRRSPVHVAEMQRMAWIIDLVHSSLASGGADESRE